MRAFLLTPLAVLVAFFFALSGVAPAPIDVVAARGVSHAVSQLASTERLAPSQPGVVLKRSIRQAQYFTPPVNLVSRTSVWGTLFTPSAALDANDGSWAGVTVRVVVASSQLLLSGGTQIRLTMTASTAVTQVYTAVYVCNAAASGSAYACDDATTQLLCSASTTCTLTTSSTLVTDAASFVRTAGRGLVFSFFVSSGSTTRIKASGVTGVSVFWISGNDAANASSALTGYTDTTGTRNNMTLSLAELFS